jgi:hypothetical protein
MQGYCVGKYLLKLIKTKPVSGTDTIPMSKQEKAGFKVKGVAVLASNRVGS